MEPGTLNSDWPKLRRFYYIGSLTSIGLAFLAVCVNAVVGPRSLVYIGVLFLQILFIVIVPPILRRVARQPDLPPPPLVRWHGEKAARTWERAQARNRWLVPLLHYLFTPVFFLLFSIVSLIAAVLRKGVS